MAQHIGIVGATAEGAALCYRTICNEAAEILGRYAHPEVTIHTHSFADYYARAKAGDWPGVGELMLDSAQKLASAGADFLICPANTMHAALRYIEPRSPLPWLHIADGVADHAAERGFRRLGLMGTRWLVEGEVYPERVAARGLALVLPSAEERAAIDRIILEELVLGVFEPETALRVKRSIATLKADGCDAAILGCTELPLIVDDGNSPLPTLDSTRLLARAALRRATT